MATPLTLYAAGQSMVGRLTKNDVTTMQAITRLCEVEDGCDPRFYFILAGAWMEQEMAELAHDLKLTNGRRPYKFCQRVKTAHAAGLIDRELYDFLMSFQQIRTAIQFRSVGRSYMQEEAQQAAVAKLYRLSSTVAVWSVPASPAEDWAKGVFSLCLAGMIAIAVEVKDDNGQPLPRGFDAVVRYMESDPPMSSLDDLPFDDWQRWQECAEVA